MSAGLAPGIEHVAAIVEVKEVGLGGAHRLEMLEHLPQFSTNSLKIVKSAQVINHMMPCRLGRQGLAGAQQIENVRDI